MHKLTHDEAWEFFDSKPGWGALSTIESNGFPHLVAIGYFRLGTNVYCGCRDGTQKTRNIDRNPKAALMLENGRSKSNEAPALLKGAVFQGSARVVRDPQEFLEIKQQLAQLQGSEHVPTLADIKPGVAYIEIVPTKIYGWTRGG